jgi:predicted lactoylglutathione lyase
MTKRSDIHEAACLAYGWLWHSPITDNGAQRARIALINALTREDLAHGIRLAQAAGARVDGEAIEAQMMRGLE